MQRPTPLTVTQLEDRTVPATFGYTWVNPDNITFSVVPDGTDVGGVQSTLKATLGATMTETAWSTEIQKAFQAWVDVAGINVSPTWDNGAALGGNAPLQGSMQFGDIRISARPLSDNVVAITNPPDLMSPWAGEIVLNSTKAFSVDGAGGTYALRTVFMHEVGHALGLPGTDDDCSVMYEYGGSACMDDVDVAAVQALYGPRVNDASEGATGNNTAATATPLPYIASSSALTAGTTNADGQPLIARADLAPGDIDYYTFRQVSGSTMALINLQSSGLSLLRARVQVFDKDGNLIKTATGSSWSNNATALLTNLSSGNDYTIRVDAEPGTPFAVGGYRIGVGSPLATLVESASATVTNAGSSVKSIVLGEDNGTAKASNETIKTATNLGTALPSGAARWDVAVTSQFAAATDVDVYKIRTAAGTPSVMLVAAWSDSGADPDVTVQNSAGKALKATVLKSTVLTNSTSTHIIQIEGITANTDYYVSVRAASFGTGTAPKAYRFGIDFRTDPIVLPTLAAATLTSQAPQVKQTLTTSESQGFQFTLSATDTADKANTAARLTVFDAAGNAVFTLVAQNGQTVSGMVLLAPGTYTIVIAGATADGSPLKGLAIDARIVGLTDPIGPALADDYSTLTAPTSPPVSPPPPPAPSYTVTDPVIGIGFLALNSLYSSPWW